MNTVIIANPASGGYNSKVLDSVKKILESKCNSVKVVLTERAGHATELAASAEEDLVIAAGGDGLINEVAQGIIGSSKFLSVLPFGTANVFCTEYGISLNPIKAAKNLNLSNRRHITAGYMDNRLFLLMVGFGFDAETVKMIHLTGKKYKFKKNAHILNGLKVLLKNKFKSFNVFLNGHRLTAYHLIVAVASSYGGDYKIGKIHKGKLNIFSVASPKLWSLIKTLLSIFLGKGIKTPAISTDYLKINGALCCQVDGEFVPLDRSSVFLKVKRNALILIY